ncbi:MAG: VCBS repeat-containing protein [candidate division WOR-3 bacterium]|uniref:VCBS repeat-containing protein n=1 Tax=candidate division WOR-3 bacterium TaxID=2052148 RepID=A0A7C1SK60_UNCW3|nr:VCBS repeat-containing protein [candidate division WOR-3 bacterium]
MNAILVILIALQPGLKIEFTGPETEVPGMLTITPADLPAELPATDELRVMPGWPKKVTYNPQFGPARGITLADLDADGRQEVIMPSTAGQLHVWRYDGSYYPGWPKSFSYMGQYAAAAADIDRDGLIEIAICTRGMTSGGAVYVYDRNGNVKPGFPFNGLVNGNFADSPTLADIDGDDTLEIIAGERDWPIGHLHVLRHNGTRQPGAWPCSLDHVPALGAAVGDINLDGQQEIVYASYNSLYVLHPDGTVLPGWPVTSPNGAKFSYQSPALADLDGDDTLEIIVAMHQGTQGVYVFRHNGTIMNGWPCPFPRWTYCPPTVADLYLNGELNVLCGLSGVVSGGASVLYALSADGSILPGFPVFQPNGDAAEGNITVADIDGDGDMEIIFTSNLLSNTDTLGYLFAVHHDGTPVSGWPLRPRGWTYLNGATVADVDGDDTMDIVAVSYDNANTMSVTIWETDVPWSRTCWQWPTYQFDMQRTGLYRYPVTGISEHHHNLPGNFRLVPGVARTGEYIRFQPAPMKSLPVRLYDHTGARIYGLTAKTDGFVLPPRLAPGIYFVQAGTGQFCQKLLITR